MVPESFGEAVRRWRKRRGMSLRQVADLALIDHGHLSRIERGIRPPNLSIAKALDTVLDTNDELACMLATPPADLAGTVPADVPYDPMRRRTLVRWSLAAGTVAGLASISADTSMIGRIGAADVDRLATATARLYALDYAHGGDELWELAAARAADGYAMLEHGTYAPEIGARLLWTTGRAQLCAGWLASDAGHHDVARAHYTEAVTLARQGGDQDIESNALMNLAAQSNRLGRPREGLRFAAAAEAALPAEAASRMPVIPQLRRSVSYAHLGDARAADTAITAARNAFDADADTPPPAWYAFANATELDGIEGTCALTLGQARRAERALERAVTGCSDRYARNRALYRVRLAQARHRAGEVDGAAETLDAALDDLSGEVASWRISSELHQLVGGLREVNTACTTAVLDRYASMSRPSR